MFRKIFYILISEFSLSAIAALHLSRVLYKFTLFMQNKPNFRKAEMNISPLETNTYENQTLGRRGKNKPNQTQFRTRAFSIKSFQLLYPFRTISRHFTPALHPISLPFCTISNNFHNRLYFNNLQENTQKNPHFSPKNRYF
jgi:hypothetical protein